MVCACCTRVVCLCFMEQVHMPFESVANYSAFSIRVPESEVEQLDTTLRAVPTAKREAMREAMQRLWPRFIYAQASCIAPPCLRFTLHALELLSQRWPT